MTRESMTSMLSEALCVSREEATAALEARQWDVPEAARLLQRRARAMKIKAARGCRQDRKAGFSIRSLFAAVSGCV